MTPLGHASISLIAGTRLKQKHFYAILFGSLVPDIDFLLLPFGAFNTLHRALTHNVFFLLIVAILVFTIPKKKDIWIPALILAGGLVHLFIDSVLDANSSNGIGVALFWPVSGQYYSPFNLMKNLQSEYTWEEPVKFLLSLGKSYIIELPFLMVALFMLPKRLKHAT